MSGTGAGGYQGCGSGAQAQEGKDARGAAPAEPRAVPVPGLRGLSGLSGQVRGWLCSPGRGGAGRAARPPSGSAAGPSGARDVQPGREPAQQEAAALR